MPAVEMLNINKSFGKVKACNDLSIKVEKGTVHALIGENGAGKSTLMKILFGLIEPDSGEIKIEDRPVKIKNSRIAIENGLGMVHQHLKLIHRFTVLENIVLGCEPQRWGFLHLRQARENVKKLIARLGFNLDLDEPAENLSLGQQQYLEIVKALYRNAKIMILDEPTAVLNPTEIKDLLQLLRNLANEGHTIIFITHKLQEVMAVADTVTVIRKGDHIKTLRACDTNPKDLACLMIGHEIKMPVNERRSKKGKAVIELNKVSSVFQHGRQRIENFSFKIHAGEIFGLAGVAGNGQTELVELLTGLRRIESGKFLLNGQDVTRHSPLDLRRAGITHIPEDRLERGVVADLDAYENFLLGQQHIKRWNFYGFWRRNKIQKEFDILIDKFNVSPACPDTPMKYFSGGNQQKIVLAREISQLYSLLIACQPTRGLDLAASAYVYQRLLEEKENGKAILLISTELDEIMSLSDRVGVLSRGSLLDVFDTQKISVEKLGSLMGGHVECRTS